VRSAVGAACRSGWVRQRGGSAVGRAPPPALQAGRAAGALAGSLKSNRDSMSADSRTHGRPEVTPSLAKMRRRGCNRQEMRFSTEAMTLFWRPCATIRTISTFGDSTTAHSAPPARFMSR